MSASSWAGIVGAGAGLVTAFAAVIGVLPALIKVLRQVREVHTIVNQQRTEMLAQMARLEQALRSAGVAVPVDPAV